MLRTAMREAGVDYYLVPTADFHNSEYVSGYFKAREFLSGFTEFQRYACGFPGGSRTLDGRAVFRAGGKELADTGIRLFRMQGRKVCRISLFIWNRICGKGRALALTAEW